METVKSRMPWSPSFGSGHSLEIVLAYEQRVPAGRAAAGRTEVRLQRWTRLPPRIAGSRWFTMISRPLEAETRDCPARENPGVADDLARPSRRTGAMGT